MVEATVQAALDIDYPHETYILNDGRLAEHRGLGGDRARSRERLGVTCFTRTTGVARQGRQPQQRASRTPTASSSRSSTPTTSRGPTSATTCSATSTRASPSSPPARTSASTPTTGSATPRSSSTASSSPPRTATTRRSAAATASSTGARRSRTSAASASGTSSRTCTPPTSCTPAAGRASTSRGPVTTGTAPGTAAEMAAQRLRWATDSLRLFFWDNPFRKPGLTFRQKLHYAQTTGVYYLATAFQVAVPGLPGAVAAVRRRRARARLHGRPTCCTCASSSARWR